MNRTSANFTQPRLWHRRAMPDAFGGDGDPTPIRDHTLPGRAP